MRKLPGSKYKIIACSCVLVALQSASGRAAPPGTVSPYYHPAQAAPQYYGTPSGNPQATNQPYYPRPHYYNPQGRSPGYSHPDWYANPGYGRPGYGQHDYIQESYPAAHNNTGTVTSQGADNMSPQAASQAPATLNAQAAGKVSAGAAIAESDSLTRPGMDTTPATPAIQSGVSTRAERLMEQSADKVEAKIKTDDTAATTAVKATPLQPDQQIPTALAAPAIPPDPTLTMPAPAAGAAKSEDLVGQTIEKTEAMVKGEDAAATAAAPVSAVEMAEAQGLVEQTIEKTEAMVKGEDAAATAAAPVPAAEMAEPQGLVERTVEEAEGVIQAGDTATTPAAQLPAVALEPATAPGAATGTPEQSAEWLPTPLAAPAAPADPTLTMPAPAAGTAETGDLVDKATRKVEGILKTDVPAVPGTE
jgi:hypothetical protein